MSERCSHADTVAAYLLGALSEAERRDLEAHLGACAPCREDVARLRVAADALPLAVPPVAPPAGLRERLLETVRGEAELLRAAGPVADRPQAARRRSMWSGGRRLALAGRLAALLVGVALGFGIGAATDGGGGTRTVVQVRTVRAAVDAGAAPRGTALIVMRDGVATLRVAGLPVPPRGKVYEVWLLRRGAAVPAPTDALFSVSSAGSGRVALPDMRGVRTLMVTAEPVGGSGAPTSQPFISASL
jgi:anti-sigma-K factor RskA